MLKEAKRLHALGFAIHWLKKKSKQPLENGWTKGDRKSFAELSRLYRNGYNIGVRLGTASRFPDGTYLAVIDCDVKSDDPKAAREMVEKLASLGVEGAPTVWSGRGGGSRHLYLRTKKPEKPRRFSQSNYKVQVHMPSVAPSKQDRERLGDTEILKGIRERAAWEISIMGDGQQVVLPPSVHPDTGALYRYDDFLTIDDWKSLPLVSLPEPEHARADVKPDTQTTLKIVSYDLLSSPLPDSTVDQILSGKGVTDRSAALFGVVAACLRAGLKDEEILTILTDPNNYLGQCAYDHAKTKNRARAWRWLEKYTLSKVKRETDASNFFEKEAEIGEGDDEPEPVKLSAKAAERQARKLLDEDWEARIERAGNADDARPKASLKNIVLILTHGVAKNLFLRDTFAQRETYGLDTPWGGKKGDILTDTDAVLIKKWLADQYRFEPSTGLVFEAMACISFANSYHPVREMLDRLPAWDGVDRLATWLKDYFEADGPDEYLAQVFEKFLVAAVTRIYQPGAKFDWMLILEGVQGAGKSSFCEILAGEQWFIDRLGDLSDKDAAQALQGIWLVEMGELSELRKNELEVIKGFITRRIDKYRPSYGRKTIEAPRQCVFAGSTNAAQFLKDETGNRRFMPVKVGSLDFDQLRNDRNQLWAEAVTLYRSGLIETLELTGEAKKQATQIQAAKMVSDDSEVMREMLQTFIETESKKDESDAFNFSRFKMTELFERSELGGTFKSGSRNWMLCAKALTKMGFVKFGSNGSNFWRK